MKRTDEFAQPGHQADVTETSEEKETKKKETKKPLMAKAAPKSDFVPPALALLVENPPQGKEWIHETKFDGYRIQAAIKGQNVKLYTRTGNDWTQKFPLIHQALKKRKFKEAVFDGEIIWTDKQGHSDFQKLQNSIKSDDQSQLFYYVFDLLKLDGNDLKSLPLVERKKIF